LDTCANDTIFRGNSGELKAGKKVKKMKQKDEKTNKKRKN